MTDTAASFDDVVFFGGRDSAYAGIRNLVRGLVGSATMGVAAVAAVGASATVATVAGVWMVGVAFSGNPHLQAHTPVGPAGLALTDTAAYAPSSFEAKWARTSALMPAAARVAAARRAAVPVAPVAAVPHPQRRLAAGRSGDAQVAVSRVTVHKAAKAHAADTWLANSLPGDMASAFGVPNAGVLPAPAAEHQAIQPSIGNNNGISGQASRQVAALTPPAAAVSAPLRIAPNVLPAPKEAPIPLPLRRPAGLVPAQAAPAAKAKPEIKPNEAAHEVAALTPSSKPETRKAPALPGLYSRTALYDISGHTVYLPDGTRLEAHSGLGNKIDNPRYVKVRMRGPTPPNVYDLTLRRRLFHGVRAIRLNPVNERKMHGRAGMLAHTYMLGPSGQSNGCVSFKHYHRFLQAFLNGKIDRMVVVGDLDQAPAQLATLARAGRDRSQFRYVAANERNPLNY